MADEIEWPWAEETDARWTPAFVRTTVGLTTQFAGKCPRCGHMTYFSVPTAHPPADGGGFFKSEKEIFTMICACGILHPGHPEGDNSCGAYWQYEGEL